MPGVDSGLHSFWSKLTVYDSAQSYVVQLSILPSVFQYRSGAKQIGGEDNEALETLFSPLCRSFLQPSPEKALK